MIQFQHLGKDKIEMDFAIFVIAFNLEKLHKKVKNMSKKRKKADFLCVCVIFFTEKLILQKNHAKKLQNGCVIKKRLP
jgi:hypothetical protein